MPLFAPLQQLRFAYGPALIVVGVLMLETMRKIDYEDPCEVVPAFATIAMMVFTFNIANGLTAGLVLYPALKLLMGRARELNGGSVALGALCLAYYLFGLPHSPARKGPLASAARHAAARSFPSSARRSSSSRQRTSPVSLARRRHAEG